MKKRGVIAGLVVAVALIGVIVTSLMDAPRRPRPEGYRKEWDVLPLQKEGDWAIDALKRGVVQGEFFVSTDELSHCVQKFGGSGANVKLELLVETEHGVTHLEYVDSEPRTDLPEGLMPCVTRALEGADPIPTPALPEGLKWRLELNFLVPPISDLPKVKWWQRFMPERWRGPPSTGHVG